MGRVGGLQSADEVQTVVERGRSSSVNDEGSEDVGSTAGTVSRPSWLTDMSPLRGWWVALAVLAAGVLLGAAGAVGGGLLRSAPASNAANGNAGRAAAATVGALTTRDDSAARALRQTARTAKAAEPAAGGEGRASSTSTTAEQESLATDAGPSRATTSPAGRRSKPPRYGPEAAHDGDPGFVPPPLQDPGF